MPTIRQISDQMIASGTPEGAKKAWDTRGRGGNKVQKTYPLQGHPIMSKIASVLSGNGFTPDAKGTTSGTVKYSHPAGHSAEVKSFGDGKGEAKVSASPNIHDRIASAIRKFAEGTTAYSL